MIRTIAAGGAIAVIALVLASSARAEMAKMECASVAQSLRSTTELMGSVKRNLIKVGIPMPDVVRTAGRTSVGDAAYNFEAKRAALTEAISEFLESGDKFTAELQQCAR